MHLNRKMRASVLPAATLSVACWSCGPGTAAPETDETTMPAGTSGPATGADDHGHGESTIAADTTGAATDSGGSTGGDPIWGAPVELMQLSSDGHELFGVSTLVVVGPYLHAGAVGGAGYHRHWVVDSTTGEVLTTAPGGSLGVSAEFVYGSGFLDGGDGNPTSPSVLYRVSHDGSDYTELAVLDHAVEVRLARGGEALLVYSLPGLVREMWRAEDASASLTPLGDISMLDTWAWIDDAGAIVLIDTARQSLSLFDPGTLLLQTLTPLPVTGHALASNSWHVFVGSLEGTLVRASKPAFELTEMASAVPIVDLAADDEVVVWAGDRSLFAAGPDGSDAELIAMTEDPITHLAMDEEALYFVTYTGDQSQGDPVFGVLMRMDRP